jgi:hypothetical protein
MAQTMYAHMNKLIKKQKKDRSNNVIQIIMEVTSNYLDYVLLVRGNSQIMLIIKKRELNKSMGIRRQDH